MRKQKVYTRKGGNKMQNWHFGRILFKLVVVFAMAVSLALFGCDDDDDDGTVNQVNSTIPANTQAAGAVGGNDFLFAGGLTFPGTGGAADATVAQDTTINFATAGDSATITAAGNTATANTTFASCTFVVTASTIPELPVGSTYTFNDCDIVVAASDVTTGGSAQSGTATLSLNGTSSGTVTVNVSISSDGSLIVDGNDIGVIVTGSTGGTGG